MIKHHFIHNEKERKKYNIRTEEKNGVSRNIFKREREREQRQQAKKSKNEEKSS
jgi:hypothetical protein